MVTIYIDGEPYEVDESENLLRACLSLGFNIPYFCWHPAMGSVGACRQCAIKLFKDENDTEGSIVMSCMTAVRDGMRISIDDPEVLAFRAAVTEWLMSYHPHDCPVCDEGGECHLQDMTVMTGHNYRSYRFEKRTHRNQYLGPFVNHEMNRCISCYRCVRFYREHAGGRDFDVFGSHSRLYFGRHEDGVLESEFSGNLVEVCPTGVFTDKTLKRHFTRKWDLQTAPSICQHCAIGCNTIPGARYGELRRIRNRYHRDVNGYFLCDRGRYGYEFVNSETRIREVLQRDDADGQLHPVTKEAALEHIASILGDGTRVIGIGSPRASLEANYALRALVGPERFHTGLSAKEHRMIEAALKILQRGPARIPTLHEVELSDSVLVLGNDVTNTAPMLDLALRQSARQIPMRTAEKLLHVFEWQDAAIQEAIQLEEGPLIIATPTPTKLDEVATSTIRLAPDDLARMGFAIAHALDEDAPRVAHLGKDRRQLAELVAHLLKQGNRPLVVTGISSGSEEVLQAAASVAWALHKVVGTSEMFVSMPEANSMGLGLLGGNDLEAAFAKMESGEADTVIVLENDLYRRAGKDFVDAFLGQAKHVIVLDYLQTATAAKAQVVLPAATFAEAEGTLVNNEGRAQRFYKVLAPESEIQDSWRWIRDLMQATGQEWGKAWQIIDDIIDALAKELPAFVAVTKIAPPADFRIVGQKIPRESFRATGRTSNHANESVHEPVPPKDPDAPLAYSMEGYEGLPPAALINRYWAPHWNSVQALNKFQQEVAGPLIGGDPGRRLIEVTPGESRPYSSTIPDAHEPQEGKWLFVPVHHIFGSDPLSMYSAGVAQLAPEPYVALRPQDADALSAREGDIIAVTVEGAAHKVPLKIVTGLPRGVAGFPVGLPGMATVDLPAWGTVVKGSDDE